MISRALFATVLALVGTLAASGCADESLDARCAELTSTTAEALSGKCFGRLLEVGTDPASEDYGQVPCTMHAAFPVGSADCACSAKGYALSDPPDVVREKLQRDGYCDGPCCTDWCFCEFLQLEGEELLACQEGTESLLSPVPVGWCYVDQSIGSPDFTASCPAGQESQLRFVPYRHNLLGILTCQSELVTLENDGG